MTVPFMGFSYYNTVPPHTAYKLLDTHSHTHSTTNIGVS
jgi:hypothetical protein